MLQSLISQPLLPLPARWRVPAQVKDLAIARALDATSPDAYWTWAAEHMRWTRPWDKLREGSFSDLRYFVNGRINVADNCVDRHAENPATSDKPAVIWEGEPGEVRSLTYRQLREDVSRLASTLATFGVKKGDVVAIYMPNLPETFVAIQACCRIGAIYTVLFAGFSADAIATRIATARPKVVITANGSYRRGRLVPLLANLRSALKQWGEVQKVIVFDRTGEKPPLGEKEVDYGACIKAGTPDTPCEPLEANEPGFLIFTSGTESKPKGLVHSVGGFLVGAWANVKWQIGPEPGDVYWCAADVGWLTFPIHAVVGGLAHGATVLCYEGSLDTPGRDRFYKIAARHNVTKVLTAPTAIRMLRAAGDELAKQNPLPRLKLLTLQGEPLDADSFHWASSQFGAAGIPVVNAYGQTETGSTWTYPVYGVDDLKAGSCGRPVPGHRYEVVDGAGAPVGKNTRGQVVLTEPFPTLARTIWGDHQRFIASYLTRFPGKYQASDEAVVDDDGHIWVLGRADDVINVAGHRISTMEIESLVAAHPSVAEGVVIGVNDAVKGMVPVAFVCARDNSIAPERLIAELKERVETGIGGIARLDRVFITPVLPKTRAGKIMRRLLRELVDRGKVEGDVTGLEDPEAVAAVKRVVEAAGTA